MMTRRSTMMAGTIILAAAFPVNAQVGTRQVPSAIPGAPAHVLPVSAIEVAEARMREILELRLSERLDFAEGNEADLARLISWAESDPDAEGDSALDGAQEAEAASQASALSPEGMALLAELVSALQSGGIRIPGSGIDATDGRLDRITDLPRSGGGSAASASILLRGWSVAMQPTGDTYLFQDENPSSGILLEPGLVIGALGAVTDIRRIGQEVHVLFASGDSMSGPAEAMGPGIPQLPTIRSLADNPDMATMAMPTGLPTTTRAGATDPGTGRLIEHGSHASFALGLSPLVMVTDAMANATVASIPPMAAAATADGEILLSRPALRNSMSAMDHGQEAGSETVARTGRVIDLAVHAPGPGSLRPPVNPRHARAAAAAPVSSPRPPENPRRHIAEPAADLQAALQPGLRP